MSTSLVVQPLWGIGDMVWHIPFIRRIAEASGEPVDLLANRRSLADQLFANDPAVSKIVWLDDLLQGRGRLEGLWHLSRRLQDGHYRHSWILHRDYRWAMAAWLAGIPERSGYGMGMQRLFLNQGSFLSHPRHCHPIDLGIAFLKCNALIEEEIFPSITPEDSEIAEVQTRWEQSAKPWIALGLGATDARRQWGTDRFIELAGQLVTRYGGTLFLIAGMAESQMAAALRASIPDAIEVIQKPLPQVAALMSQCSLFVGNDSGMLHIAAATGTPAIGLFGVRYKKIDTYRPADPRRNIHAIFPSEDTGAAGISMMEHISVKAVLERCTHWLTPDQKATHG